MRTAFLFLFLFLFHITFVFSQSKIQIGLKESAPLSEEINKFFKISSGQLEEILKGEVISESSVTSPKDKMQSLTLFVAGMHPRKCERAMRKLSLYENYHQYMDFIKKSLYDDSTQKFSFLVEHTLLPFSMIVKFKIPRIKKEGHYPFIFEDGFLKDLKGTVIVKDFKNLCLLGLKADWTGPETVIPNLVFETFLETVGELGLEHLIRVSIF